MKHNPGKHTTGSHPQPFRPARRELASRRGERGLTIIELLIAVVVSSILVGFVFDIHGRMTSAFRSQNNIGSLQQGLRAANELVARDVRHAGFMMPDGVFVSDSFPTPGTTPGLVQNLGGVKFVPAITVFNNPNGFPLERMQPDAVHVFYADPDPIRHAIVVSDVTESSSRTSVEVNAAGLLAQNDLALFVRRELFPPPHPLDPSLPPKVKYYACMVMITNSGAGSVGEETLFFEALPPFNTSTNNHCFVRTPTDQAAIAKGSQVFRLIPRAYRIDVTNPLAAPLQVSRTGGLQDDWEVMGIGFVDLQITQRFVEEISDGTDADGDGDPRSDWYATTPPAGNVHLTEVGISIAARTVRGVEGVSAVNVPVLSCKPEDPPCNPSNNPVGDAEGPKSKTSPEFSGEHVYRQSSVTVDMRNLGVAF